MANETGFCSVDGSIDDNYSGFTGSGFANTNNATGTGVSWRVNSPTAGAKTFAIRYASASSGARPADLIVDGSIAASNINLQPTGAWDSWNTVTVNANTGAGVFDLRLQASGSEGLPNIDYIEIVGGSAAACESGFRKFPSEDNDDFLFFDKQELIAKPTILYKEYYSLMGQKIRDIDDAGSGLYIERKYMSDGSVISDKIFRS